jgi:DNA-3-methyladenine glycosylase II
VAALSDGAVEALLRADPAFAEIVRVAPPFDPGWRAQGDYFNALARAIVFQQLAGRAAQAIHGRFLALFAGAPSPAQVLAAPEAELRGAGLSAGKVAAIRDLAAKVDSGLVPLERIEELSDEEIVARLVQVRGIGRWTAEMFLIFQLRRLDVWPVDDLGVRRGYAVIHKLSEWPSPRELAPLGDPYRPQRTIAAWYCWRTADIALPG